MSKHTNFSEREEGVISLLLEGKSNKQIALALKISIRTVEFHLGNIYSRLQVSSRSEAIIKLSNKQLWESTGGTGDHELRQATVESEGQLPQNQRKNPGSTRRFSLKTFRYLAATLVILLVIAFLFLVKSNRNQIADQPTTILQQTPILSTNSSSSPTSTATPTLSPREQIVAEAQQLAAQYDQAVKTEIQKGEVEISKDPHSGKEVIHFTGDSNTKIAKLYETLNEQLQTLNKHYLALYIADVQPTPFPTQSTEKKNDDYYQQLLKQYPSFFNQLLKDGPTVMIYDPDDGIYYNRVIGATYAKNEIMADAMETLRQAPQLAKVDQEANMAQIREILGNPDLSLTFQGIQGLANAHGIEAAIYADGTGTTYSVAIEAGILASIDPSPTSRIDVPAMNVKTIGDIRPMAEKFASDSSLRFDGLKNKLLYEENSKGDIYFFRWDYRNKDWSGTSWVMMPPLLQIGISADGKLVIYINTLDLY